MKYKNYFLFFIFFINIYAYCKNSDDKIKNEKFFNWGKMTIEQKRENIINLKKEQREEFNIVIRNLFIKHNDQESKSILLFFIQSENCDCNLPFLSNLLSDNSIVGHENETVSEFVFLHLCSNTNINEYVKIDRKKYHNDKSYNKKIITKIVQLINSGKIKYEFNKPLNLFNKGIKINVN